MTPIRILCCCAGNRFIKRVAVLLLLIVIVIASCAGLSQAQSDDKQKTADKMDLQQAISRLDDIHRLLADKSRELAQLQEQLKTASTDQREELKQRLEAINKDIADLQQSFDQIAIGGTDLEVFSEQPQDFDWRKELVQVTRPLLENLKNLTEKPRKIERLRSEIKQNEDQLEAAQQALTALTDLQNRQLSDDLKIRLGALTEQWRQRQTDIERRLEVARFQLASLLGQNVSWWQSFSEELGDFLKNRGLTLFLAVLAAAAVWLVLRALLWLQQKKFSAGAARKRSTRRRILAYGYRLLTALLIIAAVLIVFYVRGDLLLLALTLLILGFLLLSTRQLVPRYISEFKLLLNLGPVREGERLIYNDLPWQVKSINVYSVLRNPDLEGVIRLPLATLADMHSRPCAEEPWFPSRAGDFLILPDGLPGEVLRQTPELVQLKIMGGSIREYPAVQFLQLGARNLSRGETFAVPVIFGIDYRYQEICLEQVPETFRKALDDALRKAGFGDDLHAILVDFKAAAASSLDYLIAVTMKSRAAANYVKIERLIQQTCVAVCNRENWEIPFTQVTVHAGDNMLSSAFSPAQSATPRGNG